MGTRIEELTKPAQPYAIELEKRCGTFKNALSAGIIALYSVSAEDREKYLSMANEQNVDKVEAIYRSMLGDLNVAKAHDKQRKAPHPKSHAKNG